jgi:putative transcriptional regulator
MKNNLKELRLSESLTQAELADKVDVSRQTIISIESARYIPSVLLVLKIARVLGKKVEDIFELQKSDL